MRSFTVLDGIGKGLDPRFDISEIAAPYARGLLLEGNPQYAALAKDFRRRVGLQVHASNAAGGLALAISLTWVCLDTLSAVYASAMLFRLLNWFRYACLQTTAAGGRSAVEPLICLMSQCCRCNCAVVSAGQWGFVYSCLHGGLVF